MNLLSIILSVLVVAKMDSTTIPLGDQTDILLRATAEKTQSVRFPQYDKQLIDGIEIIDRTLIDTTQLSDGRVQYSQYLTVTSFRDSLYYIPPFAFTSGQDSFFTAALSLNVVQPFEVDSTEAITDIKDIYAAPIWWWGIIRWILLALLCAAVGVLAYWLVKKYGKQTSEVKKSIPLRPAEIVALEKLDMIKRDKIWQQGRNKEFHTQLTDVLREYIHRRFDVTTFENTSDDVLAALKAQKTQPLERMEMEKLKNLLKTSDLVKFAKWVTTAEENESLVADAYHFVAVTTPVAQPTNNAEQAQKKEEDIL